MEREAAEAWNIAFDYSKGDTRANRDVQNVYEGIAKRNETVSKQLFAIANSAKITVHVDVEEESFSDE